MQMNRFMRALAAAPLAASCCVVFAAQPGAQPEAHAASAATSDAPAPKIVPLLLFVLQQVGGMAFRQVVGDSPFGLFRKLAQGQSDAVHGAASATPPEAPASAGIAPVVGYSIEQLDPMSYAGIRSLDVSQKAPALKTGDVFALRYSTSLPAQVRLENIDPSGSINDLGTYTVMPDQLNRIPSDLGIKLVGQPGTEVIRFYFYPCMPGGAGDEAWAVALKGKLPDCGRGPNPVVQAAASGAIRPKALVNLAQPDASMSFAGSADYRANDVTSTVALIQHEAR
jgi:hypothetical protein